jgi:hypothetical protein
MLRTMGIGFGLMGVSSTVLRHTGVGNFGGSKGSISVQVSPLGMQGTF